MKDIDDNIQFDVMPDFGWGGTSKQQPIEKEYDTLYDELVDKCNPLNFKTTPFVIEKFNASNEIYSQLQELDASCDIELLALRDRAIDELGIHISTKKKLGELKSYIDPEIYINRKPYNAQKVEEAGRWYDLTLKNADDIRALERIEASASRFIEDELRFQKGLRLKEMEEKEEDYYKTKSAEEYLRLYPQGNHAEEARFFLNQSLRKYKKKYPNGKYVDDADITFQIIAIASVCIVFILAIAFLQ